MKKNKEMMFVQTCETYQNEILVLVGATDKNKLFRYLKKIKARADFSLWVLEDFSDWEKNIKSEKKGLFCWNKNVEGLVLFLRPLKNDWEYWETLMHEIQHIVQHLAKCKGMNDEPEAQAYLFEFLFRSIRRKLQGTDKI